MAQLRRVSGETNNAHHAADKTMDADVWASGERRKREVKRKTAKSIGDVLALVGEARAEWKLKDDEEMWFRGEDAKHQQSTLQPKLYRHLPADVELVSKNILREENYLSEEFSRCGAQLYEHDQVEDWDWYFLMQHHGAPTRLLDWSDGALMGVHFAVSGDQNSTKGAVIYVIDPFRLSDDIDDLPATKVIAKAWHDYRRMRRRRDKSWPRSWDEIYIPGMHSLNTRATKSRKTAESTKGATKPKPVRPDLPDAPLVLEFPQITRRVAAQRSRFMVYGRDKNWLTRWSKRPDSRIWRIFIPKSGIPGIRAQLRDAGVTESVIFPDLDGLGRELDQLWDSLKKRRSLRK
jgi:hypothetical protein